MNIGRAVLVHLRVAKYPETSSDIAQHLKTTWTRVRRALRKLHNEQLVDIEVKGASDLWFVTRKGLDYDLNNFDKRLE
jgi:transcription initiation factor IIE alpha subunit